MINIFFGFWKNFSVIILTIAFLFCYTNLPDSIAFLHDSSGKPVKFISKETFFYGTAGILFLFNFLMALLNGQFQKINFKTLVPKSQWANKPKALNEVFRGWNNAFVAIVNTFLVFTLLGLNNVNSNKNQYLDFNYDWMLILAAVLLILLIFSLPLRLLFSNPSDRYDS